MLSLMMLLLKLRATSGDNLDCELRAARSERSKSEFDGRNVNKIMLVIEYCDYINSQSPHLDPISYFSYEHTSARDYVWRITPKTIS